jgi:hypothetical protein
MTKPISIPINIWDDYHDDCVPNGDQSTYAYVESEAFSEHQVRGALLVLEKAIKDSGLIPEGTYRVENS